MSWRVPVGLVAVVLALAGMVLWRDPLGVSLSTITLLSTLSFWTAQATSWNILSGYSGYFSFGQGAFVGVGVYTTAVLTAKHDWNFFLTVPLAAVLATVLALGIGAVAFRLGSFRGATFALLTLAVPFILAAVARLSDEIDGGQGLLVPVPELPDDLRFQQFLALVMLVIAGSAVAVAYVIYHSRFGWALAAIRDQEEVAEALGVATFWWKMLAIGVTGAIGGVAGSAWALQYGFIQVEVVFGLTIPLLVIVMSVLGGRTHWFGPVLGAAVIVLIQDRLTGGPVESWRLIIFGALLAVMVIFAPNGLWALLRSGVNALLPNRPAPVPVPSDDHEEMEGIAGRVATFAHDRQEEGREEPAAEERADEVVVECHGLARQFGGVRALAGLDLTIRRGELVGLVGPNGSGKTTLVNLLSGAMRPSGGSLAIAGRNARWLAPHRFTHLGVARTYQIPRPFESMTVRDNVAMALLFGRVPRWLPQARREAVPHLEFVGLGQLADAYPSEINLHQRQLLEMARALATSPTVLLLDEALAGLNPAEIDDAVEVVRRIHDSGVTIVIVEHLLRVVNQLATRIVVLDRGALLADGPPREVMNDPAVVRAYLGKTAHA
jgi:ABC-type branched-subunit amino acid transport system ATPase component/ABC-type branched-subunit amino acid transport system permease subunit